MIIQSLRAPLEGIRAALASAGSGSSAVTVGIIDGLPDLSHPALSSATIEIVEAMVPPDTWEPDAHSTGICSLIFGSGKSIQGLAPGCPGLIFPLFFGRGNGGRPRPVSQLDLARAISFALERNVSIINVSAGQKSATTEAEAHLEQALQRCAERRVLLVAAAGNDGCACIHLPAAVASVLAVGALDAKGHPLEASNWAEPYRRNGLLAPGENLPVAVPGGEISEASGTSYATAIVSGVAALLLSVARREGYRLDPLDIRQILIESAAPCRLDGDGACDRYLAGTLDPSAALAMLHRIGATAVFPSTTIQAAGSEPGPGKADGNQQLIQQLIPVARGDLVMSSTDSTLELSAPIAAEAPGLSPSACDCKKTAEDEAKKAGVKPQGAAPALDARSPANVPPTPAVAQNSIASGVNQLACSCGGGQPPQIVYALGALWFDFGSEARYDALVQQLGGPIQANTPSVLFAFIRDNPQFAAGITFILMQDQIPLYAIQPAGPFALKTYDAMLDALVSSLDEKVNKEQRVSIPGYISGSTRLLNGMTLPVVFPDLRGMYKWQSQDLIKATRAAVKGGEASDDEILNFLNRVYYELRNLGVAPQERAMNYAATNAYQAREAFADSVGRQLALDSIRVVKSPICRPDSDCWDVQLQMFDPENDRRAGRIYRYTVDVSDVIPVTVGTVRSWPSRLGA